MLRSEDGGVSIIRRNEGLGGRAPRPAPEDRYAALSEEAEGTKRAAARAEQVSDALRAQASRLVERLAGLKLEIERAGDALQRQMLETLRQSVVQLDALVAEARASIGRQAALAAAEELVLGQFRQVCESAGASLVEAQAGLLVEIRRALPGRVRAKPRSAPVLARLSGAVEIPRLTALPELVGALARRNSSWRMGRRGTGVFSKERAVARLRGALMSELAMAVERWLDQARRRTLAVARTAVGDLLHAIERAEGAFDAVAEDLEAWSLRAASQALELRELHPRTRGR